MRWPALLLVALLLAGCEEIDDSPARIVSVSEEMPTELGGRVVILINDSSWTKVRLDVGRAERYADKFETLISESLVATFLNSGGDVNALLFADSARVDDRTGDMCAFGDVRVYSEQNRTEVRTQKLCYTKETALLHSDQQVSVNDSLRGRFIRGSGFESDDALTEYTFYNVTGEASSLPQ